MDSNRRYPEGRSYPEGGKPRNMEENQRIGRDINRSRGDQNWQDQYRSSQSYHNRNEDYSPEQTHYGSRPDSAYRDQSRINYGDNRHENGNQRPNYDQQRRNNNQQNNQNNQNYRGQQNYDDSYGRDFNDPPRGEHGGTLFWGEREEYKRDDYRYTSGNRGTWHTPGTDDDDDRDYDRNRRNYRQQNQNPGFFDRLSERIDNTWDRITGNNHHDEDDRNYDQNRHPQNRNFNRGYESGPRWADEDDRYNQRDRYNRRDRHDDY